MIDFEKEINGLAASIEPEGYELSPTVRSIAAIALRDIEVRYGEESDEPLPQHNATHAIDVAGRAIQLTNLLYDFVPEESRENIYELALLVGITHDWEQFEGNGKNERASANYLIGLIEQYGDENINTDEFKQRARSGTMATEYEIDDKGIINQINLGKGKPEPDDEPDPFEFIIAFADINGIAMEGPDRMSEDMTRLFFERSRGGEPSKDDLEKLIAYQPTFIKSQLNDHRIKPYIAYYFSHLEPENEGIDNPVYSKMREAYNPNIKAAFDKAQWMSSCTSDITKIKGLEEMIRKFDVLGVAGKISKIVRRGRLD
jgi:hypothetical protein